MKNYQNFLVKERSVNWNEYKTKSVTKTTTIEFRF